MVVWDRQVIESTIKCVKEILNYSAKKEIESKIRRLTGINKTRNNTKKLDIVEEELQSIMCNNDLENLLPKITEKAYESYKSIIGKGLSGIELTEENNINIMWHVLKQSISNIVQIEVCNKIKEKVNNSLTDNSLYADPTTDFKPILTNETIFNLMNVGYALQELRLDYLKTYEILNVMNYEGHFTDLSSVNPSFECTHMIITKKNSPKILTPTIDILYSIPYQLNRECSTYLQALVSLTALYISEEHQIKHHVDQCAYTLYLIITKNEKKVKLKIKNEEKSKSTSLMIIKNEHYSISIEKNNAYLLGGYIMSYKPNK